MKSRFLIVFTLAAAFTISFTMINGKIPRHFPAPAYKIPEHDANTKKKIFLGRLLFYDPVLSADSSISCASCHSSFNAFAHADHNLSHGINDQFGNRNAPALMNLAWQPSFMWDGAVNHLEVQALAPITNNKEMGETMEHVIKKLNRIKFYRELFDEAFGDGPITGEKLLKSIAYFQSTLVSANAKYDRVKNGKESFTVQEKKGYALFLKHCNSCHTEPLFSNYSFSSNGLPVDTSLKDFGRYSITHSPADSMVFKVPTLRNLSYSFPYMHDGRFNKLYQVIDHYSSGIVHRGNVPAALSKDLQLTSAERTELVSFLLTLNDSAFVFNPEFQYPKEFFKTAKDYSKIDVK